MNSARRSSPVCTAVRCGISVFAFRWLGESACSMWWLGQTNRREVEVQDAAVCVEYQDRVDERVKDREMDVLVVRLNHAGWVVHVAQSQV